MLLDGYNTELQIGISERGPTFLSLNLFAHPNMYFQIILLCSTLKYISPTMQSTVSTELALSEQQQNTM